MSQHKFTEQEKQALRNKAKVELERLETLLKNQETEQLLDEFKNKFNICETVYKIFLKEHQKQKGKKVNEYPKVDMKQVPYALKFAGYDFDKELLNNLFGSTSDKGTTVKKLRDAVTHGISDKAVNEIINRKDELFGYMNSFLNTIKTFD